MLQKYKNEILPIIYYGISTKINEKDLKIQGDREKARVFETLNFCEKG